MKRIIPWILTLAAVLTLLFTTIYPRAGVVVGVEYDYNDVLIQDSTGHVWIMDETDDWGCGDNVALLMFDSFTRHDITDDVILKARYIG